MWSRRMCEFEYPRIDWCEYIWVVLGLSKQLMLIKLALHRRIATRSIVMLCYFSRIIRHQPDHLPTSSWSFTQHRPRLALARGYAALTPCHRHPPSTSCHVSARLACHPCFSTSSFVNDLHTCQGSRLSNGPASVHSFFQSHRWGLRVVPPWVICQRVNTHRTLIPLNSLKIPNPILPQQRRVVCTMLAVITTVAYIPW